VTRFFISATYRTHGGNLGQCVFALMASDFEQARNMAWRRIMVRGRSKFHLTVQLGA
jgi:hypothetical protein